MNNKNITGEKIVVDKFGGPEQLKLKQFYLPPKKGKVRIKVLAVSVGITDLSARSGKYLLQAFTPLTPGYDCIGEIIDWDLKVKNQLLKARLKKGSRVAVCLPCMGTYTTHLNVKPWQMISVPDNLDTIKAAAVPLDYLTAYSLLETHSHTQKGQKILIHGGSGSVGNIVIRLALKIGAKVYATASEKNKDLIENSGAHFLDYNDPDLHNKVLKLEPNGLDAVFLHFSGKSLKQARKMTKKNGVVVNFAFNTQRNGLEKFDTLTGALNIKFRQIFPWIKPKSALCSVPNEISKDHNWYRKTLGRALKSATNDDIRIDTNHILPLNKASEAHRIIEGKENKGKLVLICK